MKHTSFIIHFRRDCEDRIFNLEHILRYLNIVQPYEIILINDDSHVDPVMKWVKATYPNIKLLFCENQDEFRKAYCFNYAVTVATGEVLCFYDVDILLSSEQLLESETLILNGTFDNVYPFNGIFIDVKKNFFPEILESFDFKKLKEEVSDRSLGFFNGNVHVISDFSPGGCNLISRKAFDRMGGYDSNFIGWGFEDTDYRERSKKINNQTYLNGEDDFIFHLEHSSHCDQDRSRQPHYINNMKIFQKNIL